MMRQEMWRRGEATHLERSQVHTAPRNDIRKSLSDIDPLPPRFLRRSIAQFPEEIPKGILEGESMIVRLRTEVVEDKGVVWVVLLFQSARVECHSDELALLNGCEAEGIKAITGVHVVLFVRHVQLGPILEPKPRLLPVAVVTVAVAVSEGRRKTHLAGHEDDEHRPTNVGVHSLLSRQI